MVRGRRRRARADDRPAHGQADRRCLRCPSLRANKKWRTRSTSWAGQVALVQRAITSPSGRSTSAPQTGQRTGNSYGGGFPRRSSRTGPTTCGMTSPARRTITTSPARMSLRRMSSSLWSVALVTVTPPKRTGSSTAYGLSVPVRPTLTSIASSFVRASRARNLKATAQRGSFPDASQPRLEREVVDLHHDAVDLVVERLAPLLEVGHETDHAADRIDPRSVFVHAKASERRNPSSSHCDAGGWSASSSPVA